ncbi:hypothetical protein F7725_022972, partial [Dissostichus mawsoni]
RNHVSSICSTWGREHFKTFDGDVFQFPGTCEYNLASDCHESFQEFSVHMRRKVKDGNPTVSHVVVTINDLLFYLSKDMVTVNDIPIKLPHFNAGVQVEKNAGNIKLQSKVGITVMWNGDDAVMVELDTDYANRTCGLCGDFNGVPVHDEFIHNGRKISPIEFGNKQKVHRPNEVCEDPDEEEDESREAVLDSCKEFPWSSCTTLIDPEPYILTCVQDMCGCSNSPNDFCVCSTLSEFSRQCSHAGGTPPNWRTPQLCAKQCPFNMVYEESGSPCMDTCTLLDTSSLCEDHKIDGCFCPPGTVFDDISMRGCIAQSECQCKHNKIYNSGEVYRQDREECTCVEGKWACKSLHTPATCAVEEGSHVTTFDGKTYTFHGDCYYTLAKVESKDKASPKFTILVQLVPCANQEFDTCLKGLKIVLNNDRNNVLMFTSDGTVKQNMQTVSLPYNSGDINIFHASSFHIMLQTSFGLQIQIQHVPVMQVYVSLDQSYRAKTRGLCGNFNMVLSDDMKTPQGIVEGTALTFSNSWKANYMCPDREERLEDPCSLSVENEWYAKHWCALLLSPDSSFAQCRSVVDPELYYKRCTYASCNCEKSEDCLCAVFSSYARACASKGVFLEDWREKVCDKYSRNCPASQIFSYQHQRCQLTCRSLGSVQQSCISDFLPVDGCSCPDGLYLNENGICIPKAKCPCYHNDVYINVCNNGMLHCHSWRARSSTCPSPKQFFNCSAAGSGDLGLHCAPTCLNLDSDDCLAFSMMAKIPVCKEISAHVSTMAIFMPLDQKSQSSATPVPAKVEAGCAARKNAHKLALFMGVATTIHLISKHMGLMEIVPMLLERCVVCVEILMGWTERLHHPGSSGSKQSFRFRKQLESVKQLPDVDTNADPCGAKPNRHHWATMMCSIITGNTFKHCHNKVAPQPYYENCVKDSCACDSGGDCECFCSAVAAYAQACNEASVCVAWRTPEICPVFCDYYNNPGECKWHYNPCHKPCYKTCLNPEENCSKPLPNLEGMCYYAICRNATVIFENETCISTTVPTTTIATTTPVTTPTEPPTTTTVYTTPQTQTPTTTATSATTTTYITPPNESTTTLYYNM